MRQATLLALALSVLLVGCSSDAITAVPVQDRGPATSVPTLAGTAPTATVIPVPVATATPTSTPTAAGQGRAGDTAALDCDYANTPYEMVATMFYEGGDDRYVLRAAGREYHLLVTSREVGETTITRRSEKIVADDVIYNRHSSFDVPVAFGPWTVDPDSILLPHPPPLENMPILTDLPCLRGSSDTESDGGSADHTFEQEMPRGEGLAVEYWTTPDGHVTRSRITVSPPQDQAWEPLVINVAYRYDVDFQIVAPALPATPVYRSY